MTVAPDSILAISWLRARVVHPQSGENRACAPSFAFFWRRVGKQEPPASEQRASAPPQVAQALSPFPDLGGGR